MKTHRIQTTVKGFIVGGTMLVPGVSGGSMAMILGIYDRLIAAVSSAASGKKDSLLFLLLFSAGGGLGILLFSKPLLHLIETYPVPTLYFFLGAVGGSIPMTLKQAEVKKFSWKVLLYIFLGIAAVSLFSLLPSDLFQPGPASGAGYLFLLLLTGFVAAIALVLPGISVSYLLLLMGLYDKTLLAVSQFHLSFLLPLAAGVLLGVISTTKTLEKAMKSYPHATYLVILGFVLGSMAELFPGLPTHPADLLWALGMSAAGFTSIHFLARREGI